MSFVTTIGQSSGLQLFQPKHLVEISIIVDLQFFHMDSHLPICDCYGNSL